MAWFRRHNDHDRDWVPTLIQIRRNAVPSSYHRDRLAKGDPDHDVAGLIAHDDRVREDEPSPG
jgi:hypothetical protein